MSDQGWAALTALGTILMVRTLDFFLPRGRMSRWTREHSARVDDEDEDDGDG